MNDVLVKMRSFNIHSLKRILVLIFILLGVLNDNQSFAQSRESLIKAGYIEKFTHFVQWPVNVGKNDSTEIFQIAIIGQNTFGEVLDELFSKVRINGNQVIIKHITSIDEIKNSMILFISESEEKNLDKILEYTTDKPLLTISDSEGYGEKGVLINMFTEGNYIRYEVNRTTLDKSGLKINSLLLSYAVII